MGGPGGVTGQPSTWITQLLASLLRQTEEPDRLDFLAGAHAGSFMHEIHTTRTEASMLYPSTRGFACAPRALSRFVASALPAPMTPCWIRSAPLSVSSPHFSINTHGSALLFHLAEGGVLSFQCEPLSPLPSLLSSRFPWPCQPCPSPCQQPYGYQPDPPPSPPPAPSPRLLPHASPPHHQGRTDSSKCSGSFHSEHVAKTRKSNKNFFLYPTNMRNCLFPPERAPKCTFLMGSSNAVVHLVLKNKQLDGSQKDKKERDKERAQSRTSPTDKSSDRARHWTEM